MLHAAMRQRMWQVHDISRLLTSKLCISQRFGNPNRIPYFQQLYVAYGMSFYEFRSINGRFTVINPMTV